MYFCKKSRKFRWSARARRARWLDWWLRWHYSWQGHGISAWTSQTHRGRLPTRTHQKGARDLKHHRVLALLLVPQRDSNPSLYQALFALLLQGLYRITDQTLVSIETLSLFSFGNQFPKLSIKHLFFNTFYSKRECPLCKISMGTKRELRASSKLEGIIKLLKPLID